MKHIKNVTRYNPLAKSNFFFFTQKKIQIIHDEKVKMYLINSQRK